MEYKTKRGVYKDISLSTYYVEVHGIRFYFSSKSYLKKFTKRYETEIVHYNNILSNKFGFKIEQDMSLLLTYMSIEKRGFRIEIKGENILWEKDLVSKISLALSLKPLKKQ